MTLANAKPDLLMTGPLGNTTVNAASSAWHDVITVEAKITAAVAYAVSVGAKFCYVPDSFLPYTASLVTFNNAVRMTREGGNPAWYDVLAYGASGNASTDSTVAMQAAINGAAGFVNDAFNNKRGATVYFPEGGYVYSATLQVPVVTGTGLLLKGAGMRSTYLIPTGASTAFSLNSDGDRVCLVFGTLTPDAAGVFTNQTQYCGMEDMSQSGSSITSGSVVAHQITEMQYGWMRNSICEAFPNSSIGLYLRGTTVTGGLGTGTTGPHCRLCTFYNVIVTNIGSGAGTPIGVLIQNGDENSFFNCTSAPASGLTGGGADTIFAVWVQLGRNNGWVRCLEQGDTTALKTNYVGWVLGPPQNRAGAPNGQVSLNLMLGDVLEGFDRAIWFQADASGNLRGNSAHYINPSIVTTNYLDSNVAGSGFGNSILAPNLTPPLNYFDGPQASPSGNVTITGATPSVAGNNVFACANGGATTITQFTNTTPNQLFWVRLDANTTIRDLNNGGGGDIQCWGRQDVAGQTGMWVPFLRLQSVPVTYQVGPPVTMGNVVASTLSMPVPLKSIMGANSQTGALARVEQVAFQDAGKTSTSTVDASVTSYSLPAGVLGTNAQAVRITMRGSAVTQAAVPNIKFGATVIATGSITAANVYEIDAIVTRTGAATQIAIATIDNGTALSVNSRTTPAETLSGAITIDFRGSVTAGGTLNVDYVQVEYMAS